MTAPAQAADSTPTSTAGASHDAPSSRARTSDQGGFGRPVARPLPTRNTDAITDAVAGAPTLGGTPSVNLEGRFSLSRQLGLGVSRIVIDPGHGGHDPGAHVNGLNEADLVLDVALRLEQLLLKQPGIEVVLTRRTDVFIPLEERTAIANREEADLFLSIHANASRTTKARGVETLLPELRVEPRGGGRRRARELGLGPDDAQPAGHRESHHAQQQAGRVARLRRRWCSAR